MLRMLIADDDAIARDGLASSINWEELGIEISGCAENGKKAMELFMENNSDIILTDIRMPYMDGLELARKAKEIDPLVVIIFISAYDDFAYAREGIKLGAYDYVLKPIDIEMMLDTIRKAVHHRNKTLNKFSAMSKLLDCDLRVYTGDNIKPLLKLEEEDKKSKNKNKTLVNLSIRFIEDNYADKNLSLNKIADKMYVTPNYLCMLFKTEMKQGFVEFLNEYRVKKAEELLRDIKYKIYEISELTGYSDPHYFSKIFKHVTGTTPKDFREKTI